MLVMGAFLQCHRNNDAVEIKCTIISLLEWSFSLGKALYLNLTNIRKRLKNFGCDTPINRENQCISQTSAIIISRLLSQLLKLTPVFITIPEKKFLDGNFTKYMKFW